MKQFLKIGTVCAMVTLGSGMYLTPVQVYANDGESQRPAQQHIPIPREQLFAFPELTPKITGEGFTASFPNVKVQNTKPTILRGNPNAARLSERTDRSATEVTTTADGLQLTTRLIPCPEFKYKRYELFVKALDKDVNVQNIIFAENMPANNIKRSGNTDGSVLYTPTAYFGIEHPMAKVSITAPEKTFAWTPEDFSAGIKKLTCLGILESSTGKMTVKFNYKRGAHKLQIKGVRLMDYSNGKKVAEDMHEGFAGTPSKNNTYTLDVKRAGLYTLECHFASTKETQSFGEIQLDEVDIASKQPITFSALLKRNYTLKKGETWKFSYVLGEYASGQLRRDFQNYLDRERAHPYRVFPHYNSWYDLCISRNDNPDPMKRMTESMALESIREFNKELYVKRKVHIESYLLDDGWDNWDSLWDYHVGFPNKFDNIYTEVKSQNSGIGAWLSPWGGYYRSKNARVQNAQRMGLETPNGGLSLAQPKYYVAFRDRCLQMIKDYNMNLFKFDGIGAGTTATGAPDRIAPDLAGLVSLIGELRQAKPDVFINCTVGTWASPFWTFYADAIWRGEMDCGYYGKGTKREQWITYRDEVIYKRFAVAAPLFPLNSMMSHGVIVGNRSVPGAMKIGDDDESTTAFANEVWMSMGSGTDLQECYVSPKLMSQKWWDILADGIRWLRANQPVLRDAHWVGGSPRAGEVYGYAAWTPQKATLILRNPTENPQKYSSTLKAMLEIPEGQNPSIKKITNFYNAGQKSKFIITDSSADFEFAPFGVILVEIEFK